ncbi:hypothetical protein RvY_01779-2, partial [Ramazzottius varieornatus]
LLELDCVASCECQRKLLKDDLPNFAFPSQPRLPNHHRSGLTGRLQYIPHVPTDVICHNFPEPNEIDLTGNHSPCCAVHYLEISADVILDCSAKVLFYILCCLAESQ